MFALPLQVHGQEASEYAPVLPFQTPVRDRMIALLVAVKLNGNRNVSGTLRGFDQFLNIVLDNTVEEVSATERNNVGMVVRDAVPLMPTAILAANSHRPFSVNHCTRTRTAHADAHASVQHGARTVACVRSCRRRCRSFVGTAS